MDRIETIVPPAQAGERLDRYLAKACNLSRSLIQQWIESGYVLVNGEKPSKSRRVEPGDRLLVEVPPPREVELAPQPIPLDIVYEDAHLLVVNKPKGLVVHPAPGNPDGTLVNALLYHCRDSLSGIGGELRPGIVHRIDKDTSGLLVVAKDDRTHGGLAEQFARHTIERVYEAVVYGHLSGQTGEIDAPIGRSQTDRKKMAVTEKNAKPARTEYKVLAEYPGFSHLELKLQTGRTHQIRVHMAQLGHPLAGDAVYGPRKVIRRLQGQCLHARTLGFFHPVTGERLFFDSPLPAYFREFLQQLKEKGCS